MESLHFNFNMEDGKPIFTIVSENPTTSTTQESFTTSHNTGNENIKGSIFSPLAAPFQSRMNNELLSIINPPEPMSADTAPSTAEIDEIIINLQNNNSDMQLDDMDNTRNTLNPDNYRFGNRANSMSASHSNVHSENPGSGARNGDMPDTFDFLAKSLSSANNYVSMLTQDQLSLLRGIRPSVLYEFLHEVVKVRCDKRLRRALPNECAFCKNNGENEESYATHALKDWRGRVLCPVLRAFHCPRCGATGDRAHTIKYCPENIDTGVDRLGLLSRRRMQSSSLSLSSRASTAPATPVPSPSVNSMSSMWSNFGMN